MILSIGLLLALPVLLSTLVSLAERMLERPSEALSLVQHFLIYEVLFALFALPTTLLVLRWIPGTTPRAFSMGTFDASVSPVPLLGLGRSPGATWGAELTSLTLVITAVTAVFVFLGVRSGFSWGQASTHLPWVLLFAALNAASEEWLYRIALLRVADGVFSMPTVCLLSAVVFGLAHFGGMPGGVGGVLAAGFLGYVLSRATYETGGFAAAWGVHFVQDIVIFAGICGLQTGGV